MFSELCLPCCHQILKHSNKILWGYQPFQNGEVVPCFRGVFHFYHKGMMASFPDASETDYCSILTRQVGPKDFIACSHHESLKTYSTIYLHSLKTISNKDKKFKVALKGKLCMHTPFILLMNSCSLKSSHNLFRAYCTQI
jgi:hypothetical protein